MSDKLRAFAESLAKTHWPPRGVSGVYAIWNTLTGKMYVGSAVDIASRWKGHIKALKAGKSNRKLQHSWDKYGPAVFRFMVLERCDKDDLLDVEQWWIDRERSSTQIGYNVRPLARSNLGLVLTPEQRERRRVNTKAQWDAGLRDRTPMRRTPEQEARRIEAVKARFRNNPPTRRPLTPEERANRAAKSMGNKSRTGQPQSAEERAKRSQALKAHWAKKKASNEITKGGQGELA